MYDNFDFKDRTRDHAMGVPTSIMRHFTTSLLIRCPWLPVTGLHQDMVNTTIKLSHRDIAKSPNMVRDSTSKRITTFHMSQAIESIHSLTIKELFTDNPDLRPTMPQVDVLPSNTRSDVHHLGAIFFNEGIMDETYSVHDEIWLKQLKFSRDISDRHFDDRLWLVWGDQKTAAFIRSIKREQRLASCPYDRRNWMLGPPAYFHILQALLFLIVRTHFLSPDGVDFTCNLRHDIQILGRTGVSQDSVQFHLGDPLLRTAWNARIIALFYTQMDKAGHLRGILPDRELANHKSEYRKELYDEAISRLSPDEY